MTDTKKADETVKVPLVSPFTKKPTIIGKGQNNEKSEEEVPKVVAPSGFVFGAKLADRVTNGFTKKQEDGPKDASSIFKQFSTNSSGGLFCKPASTSEDSSNVFKPFGGFSDVKGKQVELETPAETITGEEGERNVLHAACKFYIFDKETKSWQERGNGVLRINQSMEDAHSYRIIGRATGNQRVCVNSKIFADMMLERVSDKRIKISAMSPDSDIPQLVVIQSSPQVIAQIDEKLDQLITLAKSNKRKRKMNFSQDEVAAKRDNGIETVDEEPSFAESSFEAEAKDSDESVGKDEDTADNDEEEESRTDDYKTDSVEENGSAKESEDTKKEE
ncbi:unnamed protein product [Bursaphelenchus okinawaensis]|uniref:RanBD1 domain-containing protein n=1 Tax=Bursaphelenchus okinawaensis TaxID=465554 RepID=A0A811KAU7_9BILA|nr:unnamed protein product [Bursaphelenchus okinawaensis]CAG9096135.1 unnamed protein product [Bursaphelenchus okinawaensis]